MSQNTRIYEGMFLLESGNADFQAASQPVQELLARSNAEILSIKPWDDRRLAYEIRGHKRGLYALAYFQVDPASIGQMEHDCQLDERILRMMIIRRDGATSDQFQAEPEPEPATEQAEGEPVAEQVEGKPVTEQVEGKPVAEQVEGKPDQTGAKEADENEQPPQAAQAEQSDAVQARQEDSDETKAAGDAAAEAEPPAEAPGDQQDTDH